MLINQKLNDAKYELLSILSHELNSPMNGIVGFIELLEDTESKDEQRMFLYELKT